MRWRSRSTGASDGLSILKARGSRSGNPRRAADGRAHRRSAPDDSPLEELVRVLADTLMRERRAPARRVRADRDKPRIAVVDDVERVRAVDSDVVREPSSPGTSIAP